MKKSKATSDPDMRDEYDFSKAVRGKYIGRFAPDARVVLLPEEPPRTVTVAKPSVPKSLRLYGLLFPFSDSLKLHHYPAEAA